MSEYQVEVFFDGECPLCVREIRMLQKLDRRQRIRFTDIAAPEFDAAALGTDYLTLMDKIHGRLPNGEWITGVEVFRRLYSAVGLSPLVALTRLPGLSHGLDFAYERFAKNRLKWTGRCDAAGCAVPHPQKQQSSLGA
ncbi:MAG: DUF393 domain-containing protein [Polyangiaceae bacterium]|nr:DUF393 domain-containing protein [Myxococcales bacterium]MCB9587135.1 DUF393 domain-containing protein [Polyangiaceae bacterium]